MTILQQSGCLWLKDTPARKLPGVFTVSPAEGVKVALTGRLFEDREYLVTNHNRVNAICGLVGGVPITLWDCRAWHNWFFEVPRKSTVLSEYAFLGIHFEDLADLEFTEVSASYPYLDDWLDWDIRVVKSMNVADGADVAGGSVPQPLPFESVSCDIECAPDHPIAITISRGPSTSEAPLEENVSRAQITVASEQALPFFPDGERPSYSELLTRRLAYLVALATGKESTPQSMRGNLASAVGQSTVEIHCPTNPRDWLTMAKPFLTLTDLCEDLPIYLSNWISKFSKMSEVLEIYFQLYRGVSERKPDIPPVQFLDMARALEAYHRRMHGGQYLQKNAYKAKKKPVIKAIRESFDKNDPVEKLVLDRLISEVGRGNDYSFRRRLQAVCCEVLGEHAMFLDEVIGDIDDFARTIVTNRNKLTHILDDQSSGTFTADDWDTPHKYVGKMRLLLRMCILVEMGLPASTIDRVMRCDDGVWSKLR